MIVNFSSESFLDEIYPISCLEKTDRFNLDRVAVIVLAGGQGTRLKPLTNARCKPAISFGGRYSLIDIPISHSLNSGLKKIYVVGQYLATSLQKHLYETYLHHGIESKQIQMIIPEEREGTRIWYKGTADAIRQNMDYFAEIDADYFLILSGDQLYNIDFREMINFGRKNGADMIIAAQPVNKKDAKRMGLLKIDHDTLRLNDFYEKPQDDSILEKYYTDDDSLLRMGYEPHQNRNYLGSMGIYLFKRQSLFNLLMNDPRADFGNHLITTQMKEGEVRAYLYGGYWEDIGTIDSYYHANLALTRHADDTKRGLKCYDESQLIFTCPYNLPGAKIRGTNVTQSILCEGAIIEADEVTHSIIGIRSTIGPRTVIRDSILMGNEYYDRPPYPTGEHPPKPGIGHDCFIQKTIIDENVTIGNRVKLINKQHLYEYESSPGEPKLYVKDGVMIVPRGSFLPDDYIF
ncbi:MAG: NTP transferase domain-containing protein [Chlamydiia bacterium]|nr:NTP transferase domain-containing protein [Chlamydiia bacterium]